MSRYRIPYTKGVQQLLAAQRDYYASLTPKVTAAKTGYFVGLKDVKIAKKDLANGDVQVWVGFPIDDNKKASDGRIYMIDSFVLGAQGLRVKGFHRKFEYNGKGNSSLWNKRHHSFQNSADPSKALQQKFADQVFNKVFMMDRIMASPGAKDFMVQTGLKVQKADRSLAILGNASQSYFNVEKKGKDYLVKFTWMVDSDEDSKNGRLVMEDRFKVDGATKEFVSYKRHWKVHPDSRGNADSTRKMSQIYGRTKPSKEKAEAFWRALAPVIFPSSKTRTKSPGELEMRKGPKRDPLPKAGEHQPIPVTTPDGVGPRKPKGVKRERKIGRKQLVPGPVSGRPAPKAASKETKEVGSWVYTQHPKLKVNTDSNNAGPWIKRVIGPPLRKQLMASGFEGSISIRFVIHFNSKNGYVETVTARLDHSHGSVPSKTRLRAMCHEMANRLHANLRANSSLRTKVLESPQIFRTQ